MLWSDEAESALEAGNRSELIRALRDLGYDLGAAEEIADHELSGSEEPLD